MFLPKVLSIASILFSPVVCGYSIFARWHGSSSPEIQYEASEGERGSCSMYSGEGPHNDQQALETVARLAVEGKCDDGASCIRLAGTAMEILLIPNSELASDVTLLSPPVMQLVRLVKSVIRTCFCRKSYEDKT